MNDQQEQQHQNVPGGTVLLHPDHHIVATANFSYIVSPVMARHIEQELDRRRRPKWITFVDVSGARVRILASSIEMIEQSSLETRDLWRRWRDQRRKEEPWE
jgi:hypothetical protein